MTQREDEHTQDLLEKCSTEFHRASSARRVMDRLDHQENGERMLDQLRQEEAQVDRQSPDHPDTLYTKEFGELHLQSVRGNTARYVLKDKWRRDNCHFAPNSPGSQARAEDMVRQEIADEAALDADFKRVTGQNRDSLADIDADSEFVDEMIEEYLEVEKLPKMVLHD